ncbi:MAG: prolyl oligopeptidase family serine peptidase [Bacteroidetes bacterium]|nr:prolyl oligopeptidase family serine peptidase [Bacteroidota bacterium]
MICKISTFIVLFVSSTLFTCDAQKYPVTRKTDQADDYFGTKVFDPYRWLEDDNSKETADWVKAENAVTNDFLAKIPFRDQLKQRLTQLWNFPKSAAPFKGGNNYFVYTNDGLQNQFVLNIIHKLGENPVPFLDPNKLSANGTVNVSDQFVSHDGKYLAYSVSSGGSDWHEIHIMDIETGEQLSDKIEWVKFSGIAWKGNGFYYSRYDAPDSVNLLKGKNEYHKIYYHTIGTPQSVDLLVFKDKEHPLRNFGAGVTDDERYLIISASESTSGNELSIQNIQSGFSPVVPVVKGFESQNSIIGNDSNMIFMLTNKNAPKNKLIVFDANKVSAEWKTIIPEKEEVLEGAVMAYHVIIAKYMKDASHRLKVFSQNGDFLYDISLPSLGTIDELSASVNDSILFYSLTTFTAPMTVYQFDLATRKQSVYFHPKIDFPSESYETKQVFYTSKDGTKIPMFIVHKKGIMLNGNNPALLFGYGGFNVSKTPEFKIERLLLLENGGVFAMPSLRGGGEYGEAWHEAGTKLKKQNVFDDFIAAAEYLIKEKYTSVGKLAIGGRSNGGLLVGAAMTQRPELFKVAIPTVGVMDMLRYHKFTIGWAWKGDYGSSEDEANFRNLYAYSPLHNIKEGKNYPATLVTTGDHDDRVVPAHSFKFISTLQEKYKGNNPVLIRIDINAGHASSTVLGSSKPVAKQIEEQTDIFSFILFNLGMKAN